MSLIKTTLKPIFEGNVFVKMEEVIELEDLKTEQGKLLCQYELETVSIPGCHPENLTITDACGAVPYTTNETAPYPYKWLNVTAERATEGKVTISCTVYPREANEKTVCGPYFDLRAEEGGANGAGIHFLPELENASGTISLMWDTSAMPEGSLGVCAWGEGDLSFEGTYEKLRQCYFAFGKVQKITEGDFGYYWLCAPTFDVQELANYTKQLFGKMQKFFRDTEHDYRIFMRKDPFNHSGGTALMRSYMFGWNDAEPVSVRDKQNILAHEMVHNWPSLNDNPYGTSSWYSEGTAEYYCCMLPFRMGLTDRETLLGEIQKRTTAYFTNPTRHLENLAAAKVCWQDRRAQRLPYGRGIFFLANTDTKLRQATNGAKRIDDVVLAILEKERAGETLSNELFLQTVKDIGGIDVKDDWEIMRTGGDMTLLEDDFDSQFCLKQVTVPEADTGNPVYSYEWTLR